MQISELKPIKKFSIDVQSISECKLKADKLRAENYKIDPAIDPEKISLILNLYKIIPLLITATKYIK